MKMNEQKGKKWSFKESIFKKLSPGRVVGMILGNVGIGLGVSIFHFSCLGNDPYSGMNMALSALAGVSYGTFLVAINTFLFILQGIIGKEYIGFGTLINWFGVGYVADFTYYLLTENFSLPTNFIAKIIIMLAGVLVMSFAVSLYQTADVGLSPYDSIPLIIQKKSGRSFFGCRILVDSICAIVCFAAGGIVGLGTFTCAFCLGPFINFFNKNFSQKVIR